MPAGDIAQLTGSPQNTCSTNLAILTRAGLLRARRAGRRVIYAADYDGMRALVGFLMKDCCAGAPARIDPLLDAIRPALEGEA